MITSNPSTTDSVHFIVANCIVDFDENIPKDSAQFIMEYRLPFPLLVLANSPITSNDNRFLSFNSTNSHNHSLVKTARISSVILLIIPNHVFVDFENHDNNQLVFPIFW